jgi:hypothetical protein
MKPLKTVNKSENVNTKVENVLETIAQQQNEVENEISELETLKLELATLNTNSDEFMELETKISELELENVVKVEHAKSYFLQGSNQLLLYIYNQSVKGNYVHLNELWKEALKVVNAANEPKPFTWNAFTRTWNTSTITLNKNKVENVKNAPNFGKISAKGKVLKYELEQISFVEAMNTNLNDEKLKPMFSEFSNEKGKIEVKLQVISEILTDELRKGIPNKTTKLGNRFKIYNSSLELVKKYLIAKGAQVEQFEA